MKDYFLIAVGGLRKRFLRTSLTMLGIFIGIAAVVALISLGRGMTDAINSQFASLGSDKLIIQGSQAMFGPPGQLAAGEITEHDLKLVRRVSGIKRAAGRIIGSVNLEYDDELEVMFASSLPHESEDRALVLEVLNFKMLEGRMLKPSDSSKIVLGINFAEGKIFDKEIKLGSRIKVNGKQFEVVGLLDRGSAAGGGAIVLNEDDMQGFSGDKDKLSAVVAQVSPGKNIDEVADRVLRAIRRDRHQKEGFEDVTVQSSQELINTINVVVGAVQAVFIGIAAISLLVGGIGIMNTMYTSVLERTRDIGIMKAVGARNSDVMWIFLIESGMLGLVGGVIGVAIGVGLSKLVEFFGQQAIGDVLQASFPWYLIVGALSFSFIIGMVSGVLPARQAAKMHPVEALRE